MDRKAVIEQAVSSPQYFTLSTGFFADLTEFTERKGSFIQKQLRQHLFNELSAMGKDRHNYILNLGFPIAARTTQSFVDLKMTAPMIGRDLASNEHLCREMIALMRFYFDINEEAE